jgi:hypothetical protein
MSGHLRSEIDANTPLRLAEAVRIAFPDGGMTVSGLRREIARGRLAVEIIARHFDFLPAILEGWPDYLVSLPPRDAGVWLVTIMRHIMVAKSTLSPSDRAQLREWLLPVIEDLVARVEAADQQPAEADRPPVSPQADDYPDLPPDLDRRPTEPGNGDWLRWDSSEGDEVAAFNDGAYEIIPHPRGKPTHYILEFCTRTGVRSKLDRFKSLDAAKAAAAQHAEQAKAEAAA